ncbi:MAG: zinc ribbon domain-containing protein [Planctomycetes bacterium]|nr:zinc ribbon domain-containing protein [Planctomycetota bacterium]
MICASCGAQNTGGKTFCTTCGKALVFVRGEVVDQAEGEAREESRQQIERSSRQWLLAAFFLLLAASTFKAMNREGRLPSFRDVPSLRTWVETDVVLPHVPGRAGLLPLPELR